MQISLNQMVELLSALAGSPFSIPVQEQLKAIFSYKTSDWMQKVIDKHPEQRKFFLRYITDDLTDVEEAECPAPSNGCTVKRTTQQIPIPVRTSTTLFDYVGDTDKMDGYTYTTPDQYLYIAKYGSKYTKDRPKYFYANKYVYVYGEDFMDDLTIGGVWSDQRQLNGFKCSTDTCYTDDSQLDIPEDVINLIVQDVLKNELKFLINPGQQNTEVTIDEQQ